jgi:hypothetical protein
LLKVVISVWILPFVPKTKKESCHLGCRNHTTFVVCVVSVCPDIL